MKPYGEGQDLPRLTRASVTKTFTGDIEGGRAAGLRGDGSSAVGDGNERPFTLDYDLVQERGPSP